MLKEELARIYAHCFDAIGGEANGDVRYILDGREKRATRKNFFGEAMWAILVSGVSRKSAEAVTNRATGLGFAWDPLDLAGWPDARWNKFLAKLFPDGQKPRSAKKWGAIRTIASELTQFPDEAAFQASFFGGKANSSDLNGDDIMRIAGKWLPFIRETNAQYIVRNMGGDSIKYDRWLNELVRYLGVSTEDLEGTLKTTGLSLSLFDVVMWAYCEAKVKRVAEFAKHFNSLLKRNAT